MGGHERGGVEEGGGEWSRRVYDYLAIEACMCERF